MVLWEVVFEVGERVAVIVWVDADGSAEARSLARQKFQEISVDKAKITRCMRENL